MARKHARKKVVVKHAKKLPDHPYKKHIMLLYAFLIFTWVMMLSMFVEGIGGFVINFKATFFGFIIGIGATTIIFYK